MTAMMEAKAFQAKTDGEAVEVVVVVHTADNDLENLARRCRELLAKRKTDDDCPPGHWLG